MTPEHGYGERNNQQRSSEFKKRVGGKQGQGQRQDQRQGQGNWKKSSTFKEKRESGDYRGKERGRMNHYSSYGKDKDDDREEQRRSQPRRSNRDSELSKIREQQTDKIVIMKKLEKEQKAMKKKSEEKRKAQSSRPVPKQKRSQNINYTRQYENGMYEDYEDYYGEY